ncbi:unnamed protein product [Toxocara canis]|uniref:Uncharacterized protein n=1 Tax=Toxocara canis TaxID=6265 RepID=A0A183VCW3_TOXCA|nr:unnamed protein product [Toxocara canis]
MGDEYEAVGPPAGVGKLFSEYFDFWTLYKESLGGSCSVVDPAAPPQYFTPPPSPAPPYIEAPPPPPLDAPQGAGKQDDGTGTSSTAGRESGSKNKENDDKNKNIRAEKAVSAKKPFGLSGCAWCSIAAIVVMVLIGLVPSGLTIALIVTQCFGNMDCAFLSSIEKNVLRY